MTRVPLTDEIIANLKRMQKETGCGPSAVLSGAKDKPAGLSSGTIRTWIDGKVKTADEAHLVYTLKRWREITPRKPISPQILKTLHRERDRTGIAGKALLRGIDKLPAGLAASTVNAWLSGSTTTACADHVDFVLTQYRALPDNARGRSKSRSGRPVAAHPGRVPVTEEMRTAILTLKRTANAGNQLAMLRSYSGCPDDLTPVTLAHVLSGRNQTIKVEHWRFLKRAAREAVAVDGAD